MAEIRIEQKRRSMGWLWALLLLLALAAAAWYLYDQRGERTSAADTPAATRAASTTPALHGLVYAHTRHARPRPITA